MSIVQAPNTPTAADYSPQHQLLDRCVSGERREQSLTDLRKYFEEGGAADVLHRENCR